MKLIKNLGAIKKADNPNNRSNYGLYKCPICEKEFITRISDVKNKSSTKCMSCSNRLKQTRHGDSGKSLYNIWAEMKQRVNNHKHKNFSDYGGRGIKIYEKWNKDYLIFKEWSLANGYKKELSIDRIDNDKGYFPDNCRWTTKNTQSQNIKQKRKNNTSGFKGVSYSKAFKKYIAFINVNKKRKYLGYFKKAVDGAKAYNEYVINNNLMHTLNKIED